MMASPEGRISLSTAARLFMGSQVISHWSEQLSCHTEVNMPAMKSVVNLRTLVYLHLGG